MKEDNQALLSELARGAELTFGNAKDLYQEAELLGTNGRFARAVTLHQISMEECGKVEMLGAAAATILVGSSVDMKQLSASFRHHKVKNFINAYMSETTDAERMARRDGDLGKARAVFKAQQVEIHKCLNDNKNASLYVDYDAGRFTSPSEVIEEGLAREMQELNAFFLSHAANNIRLFETISRDPKGTTERLNDFMNRMDNLSAAKGNIDEAFRKLLDEWLENLSR